MQLCPIPLPTTILIPYGFCTSRGHDGHHKFLGNKDPTQPSFPPPSWLDSSHQTCDIDLPLREWCHLACDQASTDLSLLGREYYRNCRNEPKFKGQKSVQAWVLLRTWLVHLLLFPRHKTGSKLRDKHLKSATNVHEGRHINVWFIFPAFQTVQSMAEVTIVIHIHTNGRIIRAGSGWIIYELADRFTHNSPRRV